MELSHAYLAVGLEICCFLYLQDGFFIGHTLLQKWPQNKLFNNIFIYFLHFRTNKPITPRTTEPAKRGRSVSRLKKEFTELGVDMTGTEDAKFANTPNSGDKRKARSKSRAEVAKKSKKDGGDGPLSGNFFLLLTCFFWKWSYQV